jgi:hypothetical protein
MTSCDVANNTWQALGFGLARWMPHSGQALTGETGTYIYMAPEVIRHEPYTAGPCRLTPG